MQKTRWPEPTSLIAEPLGSGVRCLLAATIEPYVRQARVSRDTITRGRARNLSDQDLAGHRNLRASDSYLEVVHLQVKAPCGKAVGSLQAVHDPTSRPLWPQSNG
jgi:hypothetical protein